MQINDYFDGPFDQLPVNFIQGEALRDAILKVEPDLKGHIDRLGTWPGGKRRYMIAPYILYTKLDDIYAFDRCARKRLRSPNYYDCFVASNLAHIEFSEAKKAPAARPQGRHCQGARGIPLARSPKA
jgi:hypothetical protein